jgi:hypothetical protein
MLAFEVTLEYGWKKLKYEIEDRGLEADSPKDSARYGEQPWLPDIQIS